MWLSRERVVREVWMGSLELADANYADWTNSKVIPYSTGTSPHPQPTENTVNARELTP